MEEVKIVVREERQGDALEQERVRLDRVTDAGKRANDAASRAARPQGSMATPPPSPDAVLPGKETKAETTRRNRALIADAETDLAQARATGAAPTAIAQRERELRERKLAARFMREQGVDEEEALGKASSLVGAQSAARARAAEDKAAAKERVAGEREVTRELKEQETTRRRMTMRIGGAAVAGAAVVGGELLTDYFERQSLANRDTSERSLNARQLRIQAGGRGTSDQVQAEAWAAQDKIAEIKANTPDVETKAKQGIWQQATIGAAGGAVTGAGIGSVIPGLGTALGAGVGLVAGGLAGAFRGKLEGDRSIKSNKDTLARTEDDAEAKQALAVKKALEEETGLEVDAIHQRSKRTMSGIQQAQRDDLVRGGMQTWRKLYHAGMTGKETEKAKETAIEETENKLRDRQIAAASGLTDARAGARDIAAAARWGQQVNPGRDDTMRLVAEKIDGLARDTRINGEKLDRKDWGDQ